MNFERVVAHMCDHGFVTRKSWNGRLILCFGMDNVIHGCDDNKVTQHDFVFSLADFLGDDWIILPYFWNGGKDNSLPYDKKDKLLAKLKLEWEKKSKKLLLAFMPSDHRPKSADYMGPPGGKTPLGVKIPPLSKKEIQIGKSLEPTARELLKKYKSVGQQLPPLPVFKKYLSKNPLKGESI